MTTNTKLSTTLDDLIRVAEKMLEDHPVPDEDELCEDDFLEDLNTGLKKLIQLMKDWPVELMTNRFRESFEELIRKMTLALFTEEGLPIGGQDIGIMYGSLYLDLHVDYVLPTLLASSGLEARLQIAKDITFDYIEHNALDCQAPFPDYMHDPVEGFAWSCGLAFGLEDEDRCKWSAQILEKITQAKAEKYKEDHEKLMKKNEEIYKKLGIK